LWMHEQCSAVQWRSIPDGFGELDEIQTGDVATTFIGLPALGHSTQGQQHLAAAEDRLGVARRQRDRSIVGSQSVRGPLLIAENQGQVRMEERRSGAELDGALGVLLS